MRFRAKGTCPRTADERTASDASQACVDLGSEMAAGFLESSGEDHPRRVEHSFDARPAWCCSC